MDWYEELSVTTVQRLPSPAKKLGSLAALVGNMTWPREERSVLWLGNRLSPWWWDHWQNLQGEREQEPHWGLRPGGQGIAFYRRGWHSRSQWESQGHQVNQAIQISTTKILKATLSFGTAAYKQKSEPKLNRVAACWCRRFKWNQGL